MNFLKLGVYVAAGVGTYELLRRTGSLQKAIDWLDQQVPTDLKEKAYELRDRARAHAEQLANQARTGMANAGGYNEPVTEEATSTGHDDSNGGRRSGQMITGASGTGVPLTTDDYDGAHVSHKVGRGVIH